MFSFQWEPLPRDQIHVPSSPWISAYLRYPRNYLDQSSAGFSNLHLTMFLPIYFIKPSFCLPLSLLKEKAMAPHSSTLAWKIPWTEEPGRLQSMRSLRVGHDWVTSLSLSCIGKGNGNPLQCSCLENPRDGGAWWAAFYVVTQSWTRLKRLNSSNSKPFKCS